MTPPFSEDAVLARLARHFPNSHDSVLFGRGDDAAVIAAGGPLCVSSDLFLENVHFRRSYFAPEEIGHKALAVNISDMAACGAKPLGFTLCLGLPPFTGMAWLDAFFSGMAALAKQCDCALAGGDLAACEQICIAVTIWGESAANGLMLRRDGCRPGDVLFVAGMLGLARVGLRVLEKQGREAARFWPDACAAHLRPLPLTQAGLAIAGLADAVRPPAVMDISDGIARDLPRLLQGQGSTRKLGAALHLPQEALHPEVRRFAAEQGRDPVTEALLGGEDYALLGACEPASFAKIQKAVHGLAPIGVVMERPEITANGKPFKATGFDHFAAD
ncbi:MAG: thiamine-phosphate kinase [Desulfovibrio sp.]|nr:thiamine-phosphate kinase [Desulfovibrio sp.]